MISRAFMFGAVAMLVLAGSGNAQQSPPATPKKAPAASAPKKAPNAEEQAAPKADVPDHAPLGGGLEASDAKGTFADRELKIPTTAELLKMTPKVAIETVAEINGLVRGGQRTTTALNTLEFTATGTMSEPGAGGKWNDYKIDKVVAAMDFIIPATRFDVHFVGPNASKKHEIRVAAGKQSWNEEKPGINGTFMPETTVQDRLRLIYLTPQGAMWGALRAGDKIMIGNEAGRATISYTQDGEPVKIVLNAGMRPSKITITPTGSAYGKGPLEATCSGYKDFEGYYAPFPQKFTVRAGARPIMDFTVSDEVTNPYVMFPVPANLSK